MSMKMFKQRSIGALWMLLALSVTVGGVALAQTVFNRFGPSNGIMKGDAASPVTTSATSSDVLSLWTGTCANTTYLRGDGSCQVPPPTTGTGIPGGLNTYVQYNNVGSFSGDAGLVYNGTTDTLTAGNLVTGALTSNSLTNSSSITTGSLTVTGNSSLNTITGLTTLNSIAVSDFARLSQAVSFAGAVTSTTSVAPQFVAIGNAPGATNVSYIQFKDSNSTNIGLVGDQVSGDSDMYLTAQVSGADINFTTSGGGLIYGNGRAIPKTAFATFTGGCTTTTPSASYANSGITSCANGGAGIATVTLAAGYASTPSCVGTNISTAATPNVVMVSPTSATAVDVRMFQNGVATNLLFTITCFGF